MKHCVLIVPKFFSIADAMQLRLAKQGYSVTLLYDRPYNSSAYHALAKFYPKIAEAIASPYYRKALAAITQIDYLVVVNGQTVGRSILDYIFKTYAPVRRVLYMWDSVENRPSVLQKRMQFDEIFSFDPSSCARFDLKFLPLFYFPGPDDVSSSADDKNKIVAIGSHHADRFKIFSTVAKSHKDAFFKHLFLKSKIQFFFLKIFKNEIQGAVLSDFSFIPLSAEAIDALINENDVILDVHHPNQSGLTLRAIDALGKKMKIATTNSAILKYKACCPENVIIVSRHNPDIPLNFIEQMRSDKVQLADLRKLSFDYWLDVIMGQVPYQLSDYTESEVNELVA